MIDKADRKQKIGVVSSNPLTPEQQKRFMAGPVVSGVERTRINRATKLRKKLGSDYLSPADIDTSQIEEDAYNAARTELTTPSGGGGGGLSALDRYTQAIQGMLTGGGYRQPQDSLFAKLSELYPTAEAGVGDAMNALRISLQQQANPYANFQAAQAQASPQLQSFLAAQGVSDQPVQDFAATLNAQNAGQATAFQNLANMLGTIYSGNQTGAISDVESQRANLLNQLQQSRLGIGSQLESQAQNSRQDYMKMLLQALAKGGKPKKGRLL